MNAHPSEPGAATKPRRYTARPESSPSRRATAHRRRRTRARALSAICFLSVFFGTLTLLWRADQGPLPVADPAGRFVVGGLELAATPIEVSDSDRPEYHYSIVRGGVRSADEVERAMDRDPVVAAHYADIDVSALRRARLKEPTTTHVSYRIGDRIYFTKRKLSLKAGERVLTDGRTTIREQCGNIISMAPLAPTLSNEPPGDQFDVIVSPLAPPAYVLVERPPAGAALSAAPRADTPFSGRTPPSGGGSSSPLTIRPVLIPPPDFPPPLWDFPPPSDPPPPYFSSESGPPPDSPLPVPEPSTFVLVGIGGGVGLAKLIRSRRAGQ